MSMNTYLQGRLRNTPLPRSHGLLPLFEAVVNSIHSIDELHKNTGVGEITVEIIRAPQASLQFIDGKAKRGATALESIIGFQIVDNGIGFHDKNMASFETLDSDYKAMYGCRGVGRLLWLKAFEGINITSIFHDRSGSLKKRSFSFNKSQGVGEVHLENVPFESPMKTSVVLSGFEKQYRDKAAKNAKTIATSLFEHCLWYFVRSGGAPKIRIKDDSEVIDLDQIYDEYMFSSAYKQVVEIKGNTFELTHIKLKPSAASQHFIAWCAASRVVEEESIVGKLPGLYGKIRGQDGEFTYACYVSSPFLDEHVRPERIGFDIEEMSDDLFSDLQLNLTEIRKAVLASSGQYLDGYLEENRKAGQERVQSFVAHQAPRYRPILSRISEKIVNIDPAISDKDLELFLHKLLSEIEGKLLSEGHELMNFGNGEDAQKYRERLVDYLEAAGDIKKSDLANYVFHRKVVLDIFEKAIKRGADGKYAREELIHELIMPMRKTSDEIISDNCNLWLIDERLAFHNFLASDKPLSSMPIISSIETKEPDICALNVFDKSILVADGQRLPLASIVIIEIKRPMRNDAAAGEEKDPVEQALGYLERIREGKVTTASGRLIPRSEEIPGFCYAICDITSSVERRCKTLGLTATSDHLGYFGYNPNYKAYIEVISFDRLLTAAKERNRAFFDKLGLPTN